MDRSPSIHHIEVGVTNGLEAVAALQQQYQFNLVATRTTVLADQWVLSKNDTHFLVTCLKDDRSDKLKDDEYIIDWMTALSDKNIPRKDSVFNVCLQVCDLETWIGRLKEKGVTLLKGLQTIYDRFGSVKICTIKSIVGDVYHTLVEKKNYSGEFLPGFKKVHQSAGSNVISDGILNECTFNQEDSFCRDIEASNKVIEEGYDKSVTESNSNFFRKEKNVQSVVNEPNLKLSNAGWTTFDHVLLAVHMGTTTRIIDWYEQIFGMTRFLINSDDSPENGLILSSNTVGLRLRAMEYWKCAEVGLKIQTEEGKGKLFFVIAEGLSPLPGVTEENQIDSWIRQHKGAGIQHIALNSPDIKATVKHLKASGALFAKSPPPAYYSEVGRLHDIRNAGEDENLLSEHGILIDTEADGVYQEDCLNQKEQTKNQEKGERYLLQIFTQPVFKSDPFFMEIIQREGATGFGSGNVAALYRSVQAYIVGREKH